MAVAPFAAVSAWSADTNSTVRERAAAAPATNTFQVKPGFRIELVAAEPMIASPVAMAFDENGRLFVVELPAGQNPRAANLGRVRMLENLNDDGVFQNSTIYADGLTWPSAVATYAGGVFVAAAPDILYLKDTKGDGIADARQVVFSGFGGTNLLNARFLPNNFNWGPDNRIYASSGGVGGDISGPGGGARVSISYCDFSFDPRTLQFSAESGPSESGLCFDSAGHQFVTDYLRPLLFCRYRWRYAQRNPYYPRPGSLGLSADPLVPIYEFVTQSQSPNGPQPTNWVSTGWMHSAQGCVAYRGRAFPTNYLDNIFVADPEAHIIHRFVTHENGLEISAQRAPDEATTEFIISKDPSFRPVQLINGPDGALYVADVQDGGERGRIYRILPEKVKRSKLPQLGKVKTYDLVSTLAQGDGWHKDTAARLLYERKDPAAPALLRGTLVHSRLPQARTSALQALSGAGALSEEDIVHGLMDAEPQVRARAITLAETLLKHGEAADAIWNQFQALAQDSAIPVRYQLAFTLGELERPEKALLLGRILSHDLNNPWIQNAVLSSAATGAGDLFVALAGDNGMRNNAAAVDFLMHLAMMIGTSGNQKEVTQTAAFLARNNLPALQADTWLYALGEGLYRTRSSLALVDTQGTLQSFYSGALNLAADGTQSEPVRIAATRLLEVSTLNVGSVADWLLLICSPPTTPALQAAAVDVLSHYDDPQLVNGFLQLWPILEPIARRHAISGLLSRGSQVGTILEAIQAGNIPANALTGAEKNFLRTHSNPQVRLRALQVLGPVPVRRPEVLERFKPALTLRGVSDRGRAIFRQRCAECHLPAGAAPASGLGPALLRARNFTQDQLLSAILEPSLDVRPDYATYVLESKKAQSLFGILLDQNPWTVTLKQSDGTTLVWPTSNIRSLRTMSWSLMPDSLETGLSPQDLADVMEYIHKGLR
ncbi:MAG TPA: PVC-type heme-binding CxxCH protein [Verrucomicrobiae bacterium]|nr:PVC-type heme-binding CxxCH protein [Verrucomicrobiae bacterium]